MGERESKITESESLISVIGLGFISAEAQGGAKVRVLCVDWHTGVHLVVCACLGSSREQGAQTDEGSWG